MSADDMMGGGPDALLDPDVLRELEMGGGGAPRHAGSGATGADGMPKNMELLMDVPLEISVRLGQVRMQIRDLLKLNKGSLIELEREADEPLEIHVNNRLLAYGEVVMIKDKLGVRITDIVSLSERLESLRR
ncbi:MAG: flagellar motor switch protein FliN [Magnetococcales bacterium]|nr:flagellar motor switch protein FliN [Magnetococcales bacterium]